MSAINLITRALKRLAEGDQAARARREVAAGILREWFAAGRVSTVDEAVTLARTINNMAEEVKFESFKAPTNDRNPA